MLRIRSVLFVSLSLFAACAVSFEQRLTPNGSFCVDMPIYTVNTPPADRNFHRVKVITSEASAGTEAERLWSLRKAACDAGGDAVVEGTNEETHSGPGNGIVTRASGTAVTFPRATVSTRSTPLPVASGSPPPAGAATTTVSTPLTTSPQGAGAPSPTPMNNFENAGDPPLLQEAPAEPPRKR